VIDFPASPATGQIFTSGGTSWKFDSVKWLAQGAGARYVVACFVPGVPTASQLLLEHRVSKAIEIPANFGAALGHASQARGTVAATASTTIVVRKATSAAPGTFSDVGTIVIAAAALVGTFATSGGAAVSFAAGDTLALVAPATPDTTFANFAATLAAVES